MQFIEEAPNILLAKISSYTVSSPLLYICCSFSVFYRKPSRLKRDPALIFAHKEGREETDKGKLARSHRLQNRRRGYASSACKSSRKCQSTKQVPEVENLELTGTDSTGIMSNEALSGVVETMEINCEQDYDVPDISSVLQPQKLSYLAEECLKGYVPSLVRTIHKQIQ